MTERRPWLTITAPCPVCHEHFELTQPMADHMSDHSVEDLEAAGLKVTVMEEFTGCTEPDCDCEKPPYEGCDCPPDVWSNVDGVYEAGHCLVSAKYNDGNGESPLCHDCEHFTSFHVVNEKVPA